MPRLTDSEFLAIHRQLKVDWQQATGLYGYLSSREQWQLHGYFRPSEELSDADLLAHRIAISKEQPSLPQRAGKAYRKLELVRASLARARNVAVTPSQPTQRTSRKVRHITVRAVVNPKPDLHKLAKALMAMAMDMAKRGETMEEYGERNEREREEARRLRDEVNRADQAA